MISEFPIHIIIKNNIVDIMVFLTECRKNVDEFVANNKFSLIKPSTWLKNSKLYGVNKTIDLKNGMILELVFLEKDQLKATVTLRGQVIYEEIINDLLH